ncbi:NAD-P-binding protein [Gigaspora rosea]|uniref:NAD-P-binding protein n=1 Tax=Gigaspora rosea TaxID=44941 RepID=A0A397UI86_9GLOM|nr:NAD-P-binding protein [Gigaspora rosea]
MITHLKLSFYKMVKVLVLGASGFIGNAVAQAFARAGHEIFGLVRKREKVKMLAMSEIFPILGDVNDLASWMATAEQCDVIIDATSEYVEPVKLVNTILSSCNEISKKRVEAGGNKLLLIYTSSLWVYGGDPYSIKSEQTLIQTNLKLDFWRPECEQQILSSPHINAIIIRPGAVYGKSGSLTGIWFKAAIEGNLEGIGNRDVRWSFVHVDDLAESYVQAAERAEIIKGQIFNITNNSTESMGDVLTAIARVTKFKGEIKFREPTTDFEIAMAHTDLFTNRKSQTLLGWYQKKLGFVDGIEIWWNSFKGWNDL